jgi:hypothetical protein
MIKIQHLFILLSIGILAACNPKTKENKDEIYSRHLQKHIPLKIISTPVPKNKSDFNLLLLNDGERMKQLDLKKIADSLYRKKLIKPLIIVCIDAFDPLKELGVAGFPDSQNKAPLAQKYSDFIVNELLPFTKKKAGVRKFNSVSIAGSGIAGISALDIAWDNWQKFDKVAFLPGFAKENTAVDFSILAKKISQSRKRPQLQFWLYETGNTKNPQRNDSTNMEKLFDVLKMKGILGITRAGAEGNMDAEISFKDSFCRFLLWLNGTY